jgi:hypothetical protein
VERTLRYLNTFSIDPVALRQQGTKGRKKLVELMDALVSIHRYASGQRKVDLAKRFREVARVTGRPEYHDMSRVSDEQFHQDATSYLRACYLMDKMGLRTTSYREEIRRIKARLDDHLKRRGPHQRMAFAHYYRHLGWDVPPLLTRAFGQGSVTRRRLDPYQFSLHRAYQLTHEVFVPCDYGGDLKPTLFNAGDRRYLRRALEIQATLQIGRRNVDLLGELLASLRYLGDHDLPVYREGLRFLLASQRANGSFGDYERMREKRGDKLELDLYLHTTSVVMDILPLAFEGPPE